MEPIDLSIGKKKIEAARRREKIREEKTPSIITKALIILGLCNDKLSHLGDHKKLVENHDKRLTDVERRVDILENKLDRHTEYDPPSTQQTSQRTTRNHGL